MLHTNRSLPIELRESEAHDFGGALRFCQRALQRQELSESLTLQATWKLKSRYGISVQAAIMRARKLGLITRDRQRSLMIQLSSRGWRVNEPVKVTNERPLLLWTELASKFGASPHLPCHRLRCFEPMTFSHGFPIDPGGASEARCAARW